MQRITIVGHLNTFTGYGNHACETVRGFQKLGYAVSFRAIEISKAFDSKIPLDVQSCLVQKPQPEDWEILISTNKTAPTPGKKTLFYTMHESTVIDPSRVAGINQAEHIVVPCEWNRHVFVQNGVTRPISVIPMGFDPKVFHDAPIGDLKRIVFGAAGRTKHGRQRKGLDLIIKSFTEAFPTAKNVALKIKVFKDDEIPDVNDPRIEVVRDYFTPRQIESWLHSINVFVNVGSEAFGFWPLQALACGRPVVAPKYGGLQVLNPPDVELPFEETDAGDFFKGKWCSVKKEDLIREMHRLFANSSLIREAARQCRSRVEHLTWQSSVLQLANLFETVSEPVSEKISIHHDNGYGDEADAIVSFYRSHQRQIKAEISEGTHEKILSNTPVGIGDTLILTRIPISAMALPGQPIRYIDSSAPHFKTLSVMTYAPEPKAGSETVFADVLQRTVDMGNGHFIQRLQRAMSIPPDLKPSPYIKGFGKMNLNRVALHFDPGVHAKWQRKHIHPRARMLYPENKVELEKFIESRSDLEFIEFGSTPVGIRGARSMSSLALPKLIEEISMCGWFIGIMSGPMHIATALSVKCVVVVNFPSAQKIFLPSMKDTGIVEHEWMYPQNVHLHQEDSGPLVPRLSAFTLQSAFDGAVYPHWSDRWLPLIHETIGTR